MKIPQKTLKIRVSENIASLVPYPPGKPVKELERELGITGSIKLASNENPIGPSPKALLAVKEALSGLNRYPEGSCFYLKERLAKALDVAPEMIFIGNGSNEIIELLVRTFVRPGEEVLMGEPSFAVYPLVAQAAGVRAVPVPLNDALTIDLEEMATRITPATRLVFIANPNNPTGTIVSAAEVERFLDATGEEVIVCMDEAYYEYVTSDAFPRSIEYALEGRPVVVLRTFSKIYGLAGLRVGYCVAHPVVVDYLDRVRQPFNVNTLAQAAALAALDDKAHVEASKRNNREGLEYLFSELDALGYECVDTEANFFLVKVGDGQAVYEALLRSGVIVRPMKGFGLPEYVRVTVGLGDENKRFVETFREVTAGVSR